MYEVFKEQGSHKNVNKAEIRYTPLGQKCSVECIYGTTDKFFDTIYGGMQIFSFS